VPDEPPAAIERTPRTPGPAPTPPEGERADDDGGPPADPYGEGFPPDPFDEGAQPDPFAEATPGPPAPVSDRAPGTGGGPTAARGSAEALAEAAAGDRLALLRSVFPGRVVRLVPHAPPGAAGGRAPALDEGDVGPLETPADLDTDGADPDTGGVDSDAGSLGLDPGGAGPGPHPHGGST